MHVESQRPLEELQRLERAEKSADRARRLRVVILGLEGWTARAIAMGVGLSRRICQRGMARDNEQGLAGRDGLRGQKSPLPLTPPPQAAVCERVETGPTDKDGVCSLRGKGICSLRGKDVQRILAEAFG